MALSAPMTKLEAVNAMLYDMGERSTTTLTSPTRVDVIRAIDALETISRRVQAHGWWFNTEKMLLNVDGANQYVIPNDIIHVEQISGGPLTGDEGAPFLVVRGRLLYDTVNQTDTFVGGPEVTLLVLRTLEYEDLPSSARDYVYAAASVKNQSRLLGADEVDKDLKEAALSAWRTLREEDIAALDVDTTYSPRHINLMHRR